ncbi:MAG: hypothetical protein LBB23_03845 [Rickettsiales bacterium]|jgi:hypothetical protein|nr:hypothetical protein [Rickettsiales bacterium]
MKGKISLIFSALITMPFNMVNAAAKLPAVAYDKGSVSARELFGQKPSVSKPEPLPVSEPKPARAVVARAVVKPATISKSSSAQSAKVGDVLIPKRPNSDLWVNDRGNASDTIRISRQSEFMRLEDDYELPEEQLFVNSEPRVAPARAATIRKPAPLPVNVPVAARNAQNARKAQLDNAIAKMIERQNQRKMVRGRSAATQIVQNEPAPIVLPEPPDPKAVEQAILDTKPKVRVASGPEFLPKNPDAMPINKLSPRELKRAFYQSYISENRHLSTYADDDFDMASSDNWEIDVSEGFVGNNADISSNSAQPRTLEVRISFADADSALSKDNYNLISEYAAGIANNPKFAVQISVSEDAVKNSDAKKLAARRLAIINQVLMDSGVQESKIVPVLSERDDSSFVLRRISTDQFKVLKQTERDMFGDVKKSTSTRSLSW